MHCITRKIVFLQVSMGTDYYWKLFTDVSSTSQHSNSLYLPQGSSAFSAGHISDRKNSECGNRTWFLAWQNSKYKNISKNSLILSQISKRTWRFQSTIWDCLRLISRSKPNKKVYFLVFWWSKFELENNRTPSDLKPQSLVWTSCEDSTRIINNWYKPLFVVLNMGFHPFIIWKMTNSRHKNRKMKFLLLLINLSMATFSGLL